MCSVLWHCVPCFRDVSMAQVCSVFQGCFSCFNDVFCATAMCSMFQGCFVWFRDVFCFVAICFLLNCLRSFFLSQWQVMCCNKVFLFQWYVLWVRDIFSGVEKFSYLGNVFFVLEEEGRCVFHWCSPCFSDMFLVLVISSVLLQCPIFKGVSLCFSEVFCASVCICCMFPWSVFMLWCVFHVSVMYSRAPSWWPPSMTSWSTSSSPCLRWPGTPGVILSSMLSCSMWVQATVTVLIPALWSLP